MNFHLHVSKASAGTVLLFVFSLILALAQTESSVYESNVSDSSDAPIKTATYSPEVCDSESTLISIVQPWQGNLELGEVTCFKIQLREGEFVRAAVEMDTSSFDAMAGFEILVHRSGHPDPVLQSHVSTETFNLSSISWEAMNGGSYYVVLRDLYIWPMTASEMPVEIRIKSVETPGQLIARRDALAQDERVAWLQSNVRPIRSVSPDDTDFSDLDFLHDILQDVRVVLLGEASHNAGTDFLARSRLVKFLHSEMGFEVLAFEAPLYGMDVAWKRIQAGEPTRDALQTGLFGFWSHAGQMQSLITYIGEQAGSERPLTVAGFDYRPWLDPWMPNTAPQFAEELAEFLRKQGTQKALADTTNPEYGILEHLAAQRPGPIPDSAKHDSFLKTLDETVVALEVAPEEDEESSFWAEALRGVGCHARDERGLGGRTDQECYRDTQMGKHLLWLANHRYPDKKLIVWAATPHIMRDSEFRHAGAGTGPAMGKLIGDEYGDESYVIGMTSYKGTENDIIPDQHVLPEFEQLMEEAGFDYAFVDLRSAARQGGWLGTPFPARPNLHHTEVRTWSDVLDAFFFVREQVPRRQIE